MANNNYQLTVVNGPQEGQTYSLVATMVTIGRDPMADIVITDPEVSRQHVRLTRIDDGHEIQDLGSTNGTFLDGRRLSGEPHPLSPGQTITLGSNISLVYEEAGGASARAISPEDEDSYPEAESDEGDFPQVGVYDYPEPEVEEFDTILDQGQERYQEVETAEIVDEEASSFEFPSFDEGDDEEFPTFDEELPSFEDAEELPDFGEEELPTPSRQTLLQREADAYEEAEEGELPRFERDVDKTSKPATRASTPPPPPPPPATPPPGNKRNRNLIIAALVLSFLLCCCCLFLIVAWNYGDALFYQFQVR